MRTSDIKRDIVQFASESEARRKIHCIAADADRLMDPGWGTDNHPYGPQICPGARVNPLVQQQWKQARERFQHKLENENLVESRYRGDGAFKQHHKPYVAPTSRPIHAPTRAASDKKREKNKEPGPPIANRIIYASGHPIPSSWVEVMNEDENWVNMDELLCGQIDDGSEAKEEQDSSVPVRVPTAATACSKEERAQKRHQQQKKTWNKDGQQRSKNNSVTSESAIPRGHRDGCNGKYHLASKCKFGDSSAYDSGSHRHRAGCYGRGHPASKCRFILRR